MGGRGYPPRLTGGRGITVSRIRMSWRLLGGAPVSNRC
ncbi:hypothetical protein I553_9394 [Mycobacterium xenopi 4042]|uniref:Uncharacterized protein n=1 Tax=Mycobacterium xenopi 4042 TaxID=1299334 RepID=X8DZY4_MYCXE|nr:hypothetical protein I553_9394 [Mycobacterium xenopi 4042]